MTGATRSANFPTESSGWLLNIAQKRDCSSFIALFNFYAPKVKSYLLRQGLDPQTADEITQETFLTIWRKAEQYDAERASAAAWIYTIARNRWVDWKRRQHPRHDAQVAVLPEAQVTPEQAVTSGQIEHRLRGAIEALPVEQAEVLRLCYFEDLSHSEISRHLGLPLGTVKSRIRLAAAHLRMSLATEQ